MMPFSGSDYPDTPGVYLMKDASGRIIYVGKAKSLRKRLSSYFRPSADHSPKTLALLSKAHHIDMLLVSTEKEALLLEESLIKKHRPRYNIVLRDDKRSLLFRLDRRSSFPRLTMTRQVVRDGSAYFGPFSSASAARATLKLVGSIFPLRKCADRQFKNRVRPCLYHQLGQCLGPCCLPVDPARYRELVVQVEQFLSGRSRSLVRQLRRRMQQASQELRFEEAALLRDQVAAIEKTTEGQASVLRDALDRDVLAVATAGDGLGVGLLFVRGGQLLEQKTFHWPGLGNADIPEALESFLAQFYGPGRYIPGRVVLSHAGLGPELAEVLAERRGALVRLGPPRGPDERRLLDLATDLALTAHSSDARQDVAGQLERALGLPGAPRRIECVDISHLAGRGVRAGVVVFEDGAEAKPDYRAYALPGVEGSGDDYAALAQWAVRRVQSGPPWPDLLLIDGGRGQLAAVQRALNEAGAAGEFECASIAKGPSRRAGELEDRVFRPGRRNPVALKAGSPALLFLQRVRDAAHRFAIGKSRKAGRKTRLDSTLLHISGLGPALARRLWDAFGSLAAMREASAEQLAQVRGVGPALAGRIALALAGAPPEQAKP
ncbi:MAG: excinuclease ABC subunit UvrC [Proteobacteria bacterium]|nr:excinuclease ABC subunit UvrC [Pseudomonadota bacterium]MBU1594442.1 excinuclease ABC subunit UvrC [Pseudomonadota bacterium]